MITILKDLVRICRTEPHIKEVMPTLRYLAGWTFFWLIFTEIFLVLKLYPIKFFFDGLQAQWSQGYLFLLSGAFLALSLVTSFLHYKMDINRENFFWRMWALWWGFGHRKELRLGTDWHVARSTGEKESTIGKNVMKVENLIDDCLFVTLPTALRIVFASTCLFFISWKMAVFAWITVGIYALVLLLNEKGINPLRKDFRTKMKKIERDGTELTKNWRTIKQFGLEEDQSDEHEKLLLGHWIDEKWRHKKYMQYIMRQEWVIIVSESLLYGLIALTFQPSLGIGSAVLAGAWMGMVHSNLHRFSGFQRHLNEGAEALKELVGVFCEVPTVQQPENPKWPEEFCGEVEFKNVSFSYPNGKADALRNVSFKVKPNQTVALVGFSGSGKSTVASLLLREYDPTAGKILVDGVPLDKLDFNRYRKEAIGIVSQDVQLFDATVGENIALVKSDATLEDARLAACDAYADEFISGFPKGYDTPIGEDGIRLSGGQRQRLAIARALIKEPKILIMDEATSSLDAVSQCHVQETIDKLIEKRSCTLFVIAHRFSTIMSADVVVVMKDGEIAEFGSHEELAKCNGIYKRLRDLETEGILAA